MTSTSSSSSDGRGAATEPPALGVARRYVAAGFSIVPILTDGSKKPGPAGILPEFADAKGRRTRGWTPLKDRKPTEAELRAWWGNGARRGFALIHGAVSGGSEVLDFDAPGAFEEFAVLCADHGLGPLLASLVSVETPSGGRHLLYRYHEPAVAVPADVLEKVPEDQRAGRFLPLDGEWFYRPEGNQKLARRPVHFDPGPDPDPAALARDGARQDASGNWYKVETKIETRGEGGYTVAPGSPKECHPSGREYRLLGGRLDELPAITAEDRAALLAMARACNEYVEPEQHHPAGGVPRRRSAKARGAGGTADRAGLAPGDDFNERADPAEVLEILKRHGWQEAGRRGDTIDLARPGKSPREGMGATLNHVAPGWLYVFTSAAPPFEPEHGYSPFSVFGLLECGGDFKEAAKRLASRGFGDQTPPAVRTALRTAATGGAAAAGDAPAARQAGVPLVAPEDAPPPPPTDADAPFGEDGDPGPPPRFQLTDVGNARRLIHRHGRDLRFCYAWDKWLVWDGRRWREDEGDGIEGRAKETAEGLLRETVGAPPGWYEQTERDALIKHSLKMQSAKDLRAMVWAARSDVPATPDEWDRDRWLLNVHNGTLDLRTGRLRPHDRGDRLTKVAGTEYRPDAPAPRWEAFVEEILPDAEVRAFAQRACGYALTGDVSEQCLFFLYGSGSNGKSTMLRALMDALGDYSMQAAPDLLIAKESASGGPNNDVAELRGRRLVATIEVEDGKRMAEGLVKQITGGDRIKARFMRQDFFEFEPSHKIFLAANHKPTIRGQDFAIWRRIKVIPFEVQIADERKDPTLPDKLREELPGVLAWAVCGALEWQRSGLREPDAVKSATDEYRGEMDVLRDFIEERCLLRPSLTVTAARLYQVYEEWCEDNSERPLGKKQFGVRLREHRGIRPETGIGPRAARGWAGIAVRSDREDEPNDGVFSRPSDTSDFSDPKSPINTKTALKSVNREITSETSETSKTEDTGDGKDGKAGAGAAGWEAEI